MLFAAFFVTLSTLILVTSLFVVRRRDSRLRAFGIAGSLTLLALTASALLRLGQPAAEAVRLMNTITVANLSAASVLVVAWTVRSHRSKA